MRTNLIILCFVLSSCDEKKLLEQHESPAGNYILQIELDNSKPNDEHLGLKLLKKNGGELDHTRTLAGDHMKWAVTWYNDTTIIMDSHDVGTYGWTFDRNRQLNTMDQITRAMEDKTIEAFEHKYGTHSIQH